jgi:hypothetical protein
VRSGRDREDVVKLSIIDGSFFETVPKSHLFYQLFLQVFSEHLKKKGVRIPPEKLKIIEESLSYITDQTIIASSKVVEKASIKPRLRIMAEVHLEGNPHSKHYPIPEKSFNLILHKSLVSEELKEVIRKELPQVLIFSIYHKRNGEHVVFCIRFGQKLLI